MLTPYAVVCSDLAPLETCQQLFGGMTPDPAATIGMLVKDRAKGCYTVSQLHIKDPTQLISRQIAV